MGRISRSFKLQVLHWSVFRSCIRNLNETSARCGHTICAGCIEKLVEMALGNNVDGFTCPHCNSTQPVDIPCQTNWILKSHMLLSSSITEQSKLVEPNLSRAISA